jgi:choline dehydrogenase-like flavoprotein
MIIGSGAAGGVLAATLSALTEAKIVLVEKGGYFTRTFFNQREWDMRVLRADEERRSTADGAIPVRGGECVGGGTTVNYALCLDPIESVWSGWKEDFGLNGFSFDESVGDYRVEGLNMASCLAEIRQRLNVHLPSELEVNGNNRLLEAGCSKLGISTKRFELNQRDCLGCGYCGEGCAYDRKQGTMITYIADALDNDVQLIHHCDIDRLELRRHRGRILATGARGRVRATYPGSLPNVVPSGPIRLRAKLVIVCGGAIESPWLLQRSGHPDPHRVLGRGLILHPSVPVAALMDRDLVNYRGISGTVYSDHFYESDGFYFECLFGHPTYGAVVLPGIGAEHFELMLQLRRIAGFGLLLIDTVDPRNRVCWKSAAGSGPIRYALSEADKARLRKGLRKAVEVMFAAGAREVLLPSDEEIGPLAATRFRHPAEAVHCEELRFLPHRTTVTSAHCQGTVKMGNDVRRSMVSSRCESHHVENLIVCDSSVFPTSCGTNPMISIMTLARYQGIRIASEASRYGL